MILRRRDRVRLRRLEARDAGPWRALRAEALALHPEAFGETHDPLSGQPLAAFADALETGLVLGAFDGEDLVGSMALDVTGAQGELRAVYVRPDRRGQGLGRRLLRDLLAEAKRQGVRRLDLSVASTNHPALRFYLAAGFRSAGQPSRALARDGRLLDLIVMTRAL